MSKATQCEPRRASRAKPLVGYFITRGEAKTPNFAAYRENGEREFFAAFLTRFENLSDEELSLASN